MARIYVDSLLQKYYLLGSPFVEGSGLNGYSDMWAELSKNQFYIALKN